ncbi:hypothetical protein Acor_48110 [Acrocarpospora corrugata]|uniref:Serine protease n=1 Tax=Acrocarpospora corrugata TaxID=35763 RepID=A0A5M3W143_9ACTN|nr:hypothetical protein [Acrocarpospora corrugata]GES02745.1 hypothetical protein Acor_48110 [Acrocarpospora corrugata]
MKSKFAVLGVGLLGAALLATPAGAAGLASTEALAADTASARLVAEFWLSNDRANLANATPYNVQTAVTVSPAAAPIPDGNRTIMAPTDRASFPDNPDPDNVLALPRTTGKVFFVAADGQPHWCSATSVSAFYRNLVTTAGHCVFDPANGGAAHAKWVFVPTSYRGKTPYGLYVGRTGAALTELRAGNYSRDYAVAAVWNGVDLAANGTMIDKGRLVEVVGGQGLAWNQPMSTPLFGFGYPAGTHPDGTKPYSGLKDVYMAAVGTPSGPII